MRTILGIALPLALIAAAVLAAGNYVEFFAKSPGLVLAGSLLAFVAYLPSLWVTRRLDRQPMRWAVYAAVIGFVVAIAPITSEVTWGVINRGVRYWQIVGLTEELTKMLPVLLALVYAPHLVRNTRDGLVLGALGARHARPHPVGRGDRRRHRLPRRSAPQSQAPAGRVADDRRRDGYARPAGHVRQVHRAARDRRDRSTVAGHGRSGDDIHAWNVLVIPILWQQIRRGSGREHSVVTA